MTGFEFCPRRVFIRRFVVTVLTQARCSLFPDRCVHLAGDEVDRRFVRLKFHAQRIIAHSNSVGAAESITATVERARASGARTSSAAVQHISVRLRSGAALTLMHRAAPLEGSQGAEHSLTIANFVTSGETRRSNVRRRSAYHPRNSVFISSPRSDTSHRTSTLTSSTNAAKKSCSTSNNKYGRHRAALAATVITYRRRMAIRDVARALGLPLDQDKVRRSMAAWQRKGGLADYRDKLLAGMLERGYSAEFAEQIYNQILGFGSYGFPQSHSARSRRRRDRREDSPTD
jgi:hypothetical protein